MSKFVDIKLRFDVAIKNSIKVYDASCVCVSVFLFQRGHKIIFDFLMKKIEDEVSYLHTESEPSVKLGWLMRS